jgi:hypothetical protein
MEIKLYYFSSTLMLKKFCVFIPMLFSLKEAVVMNEWAGLRPSRPKVRLERDHIRDQNGNTLEVHTKTYALYTD